MSDFIEVKVSELTGAALDYMTHNSIYGWNNPSKEHAFAWRYQNDEREDYSTDWRHGGELISKYRISFEDEGDCYSALLALERPVVSVGSAFGSTHLVAACRAIVHAKLGETVLVPKELLK